MPRDETTYEEHPDGFLAEGDPVLGDMCFETLGEILLARCLDPATQTCGLQGLETVLEDGLLCSQLQEQQVRLDHTGISPAEWGHHCLYAAAVCAVNRYGPRAQARCV